MTDTVTKKSQSPAERLADSAFAIIFLAFIASIITWIGLVLSPSSPSPAFAQIRLVILAGFGAVVALILVLAIWIFRTSPKDLVPTAHRINRLIGHLPVALIMILVVLQGNIMAFMLLNDIAPAIVNPLKFFLVCSSLLLASVLFIANQPQLETWFQQTRQVWQGIGISSSLLIIMAALLWFNNWFTQTSRLNDQLRGSLDYRQLSFYEPGATPSQPDSRAYFTEQAQTRVRWSPYTYWVMQAFDGDYININADGIRQTPQPTSPDATRQIHIFGGSTVWGEGARDAYTIPGHLSRLLHEAGSPAYVTNYGQSGYVSTQDMLFFQWQLIRENTPDTAVFYQGFNDVLSAYGNDKTGLTLQENMRLIDSELGRWVRAGFPAIGLPHKTLEQYDFSQAAVSASSPAHIADRWLSNVQMIRQLAGQNGVDVLFVWQPAIIHKNLTPQEEEIYNRWQTERPGFFDLYAEVDTIVRERVEAQHLDHILIMSDLFETNTESLFIDLVHITEIGNARVAQALHPHLLAATNTD